MIKFSLKFYWKSKFQTIKIVHIKSSIKEIKTISILYEFCPRQKYVDQMGFEVKNSSLLGDATQQSY